VVVVIKLFVGDLNDCFLVVEIYLRLFDVVLDEHVLDDLLLALVLFCWASSRMIPSLAASRLVSLIIKGPCSRTGPRIV
jgi:hypothetical protein